MKLPENMSIITGRKYNGSYDDEGRPHGYGIMEYSISYCFWQYAIQANLTFFIYFCNKDADYQLWKEKNCLSLLRLGKSWV